MASNGTPRKPHKKKKRLSFSTANIGTSSSQGLEVASLTSPSQLVLGYSAGQLIRTPPVASSSKIEDRKSPRSPTPRSKISSLARPRAIVNHPNHALGNKASLSRLAKSQSPFATTETSLRDLSNIATTEADEIPVVAKMATLNVGDCDSLGTNLMGEASTSPLTSLATVASAPRLISNLKAKGLGGDKILNHFRNEGDREKNQTPLGEVPVTPAQEPLLTTNSEFPTNTDANKQQWKAAVRANNPSRNPFNLNIPNQVHRRTESQGSQGISSTNNHLTGTALSNTANAYIQMAETVEKANGSQGNSNNQPATTTTGRNPFSGPSVVAALDLAPDFEANFAEMMATLENSRPGDLMYGTDTSAHQPVQYSFLGAMMRQSFEDMSQNEFRMRSGSQSSIRSMNHSTTQETMMNTGSQIGKASSAVQVNTPERSSAFQMRSPFQTSMQPANHPTTQQNITNGENPFGGTSQSTGQEIMINSSLASDFPNTTQMPQFTGQGDMMNNGGYNSGAQDSNASSADIIGDFAREYGSMDNNAWLIADINESSTQENPVASMIGASPSTHANARVDMVGSSTQAPLPNDDSYPMDVILFTGRNNGDLSSVSGGYNMNFPPNTSSQMMGGAFASELGPDTQTFQQSSPRQVIRQSSSTPVYGHTPNNSMGSGFGHMDSHALNSPNRPVQSALDLRRSATPSQSAINCSSAGSSAVVKDTARSTRSSSTALAAPEISFDEVSPNPLHPASFHRDTPRSVPDMTLFSTPNHLHPPSFHQPTPRAPWPTSRVPIPPNPAVSGNTPGYFEPPQTFKSQGNTNSNINLMNLNRDMLMQFNPAFQQHQYSLNQRGQNNLQLPQQFHHHMRPDPFEYMMNQAAMEIEANERGSQANNIQGYTPPVSPPVPLLNNLFRQRVSQFEHCQPPTDESAENLRRYQTAARINTSIQGYNLNGPMPFDGKPPPRLPNYLTPDRRSKKVVNLDDQPLAINRLTIGENFECDFCTGKPNSCGIDRYNHDFVEIWGPAGRDWCGDCKRAGKHIPAVAVPENNTNQKVNNKGKRPAKDPAGPGPTPKKPTHPSSNSSNEASRLATSGATASYDRYAPLSEESNVFGDPLEILSPIDNMLINPFMHNLMCRGSEHRQIDLSKTKICLTCKLRKMEIINHGRHEEFTHIVALNTNGQWQIGYGRQLPVAGQRDRADNVGASGGNFNDFRFDVSQDLNEGNMTLKEINSIVNIGLNAGGTQTSSGGMSSEGINPSGLQSTSAHSDSMNSRRNSLVDSRTNPRMSTSMDFDIDSDLHCDMNSILNSSMDSMFGNDDFSWGRSGWLSTHSTSTSNSAALLPTPAPTTSFIATPSPRDETHDHQTHMNRLPHRPISKTCMICPATSVFLCDGCSLILCERCRYRLRDAKGWFNNLIYSNGVNHNRNDAFLLRSDDGGYHDYGKFWPVPAHVNGKGVFGDGGR